MEQALTPEILENIKSFNGDPGEMTPGERMLSEGKTIQRVQTQYSTAVSVQKPRSITKIAHKVLEEAKLAGASFYYGWMVKTKRGPKRVEGASIDLGMSVARNYGNCVVDVEENETFSHFQFKGIFIDLESGFTSSRLFRQRKGQSLGMDDDQGRQEDVVFQIGQSKAIRNAVIRSMPQWLIDQAIETAKAAELGKIKPENLHLAREKALGFFEPYGVTQEQVEEKIGRPADQWTAEDILELRGMATALKEERISANELFATDGGKTTEKKQSEDHPPFDVSPETSDDSSSSGTDTTIPDDILKLRQLSKFAHHADADLKVIAEFYFKHQAGLLKWEAKYRPDIPGMSPPVKNAWFQKFIQVMNIDYNTWLENLMKEHIEDPGTESKEPLEDLDTQAHTDAIKASDEVLCPIDEGKPKKVEACTVCDEKHNCQPYAEYFM